MKISREFIAQRLRDLDILPSSSLNNLKEAIESIVLEKLRSSKKKLGPSIIRVVEAKALTFAKQLKIFWPKCQRTFDVMIRTNQTYFSGSVIVDILETHEASEEDSNPIAATETVTSSTSETPDSSLAEKGRSQRYLYAKEIRTNFSPDSILLAGAQSARAEGHFEAAYVIRKISSDPEKAGPDIKKAMISKPHGSCHYSFCSI